MVPTSKQPLQLIKAYNDYEFLNSPVARPIRILAEMIEPAERLRKHKVRNTVVIFGSARVVSPQIARQNFLQVKKKIQGRKNLPPHLRLAYEKAKRALIMSRYYADAVELSRRLTLWFKQIWHRDPTDINKHFLVCSGGGPGIMEAANLGAHKAKWKSIGLNISLPLEQAPNRYQSPDLAFEFHYFFIRKFWFFYLAKALIIFPGGFGTLDEMFELLTLMQTKKSVKYMPIILYGSEYWNKLINFQEMKKWGTIQPRDLNLFKMFDDVDSAFRYLKKELTKHYLQKRPPRPTKNNIHEVIK